MEYLSDPALKEKFQDLFGKDLVEDVFTPAHVDYDIDETSVSVEEDASVIISFTNGNRMEVEYTEGEVNFNLFL